MKIKIEFEDFETHRDVRFTNEAGEFLAGAHSISNTGGFRDSAAEWLAESLESFFGLEAEKALQLSESFGTKEFGEKEVMFIEI